MSPIPLVLSAASNGGAAKIYISNKSEDPTEYVNITMGTSSGQEIGRLYAGDWLFMPWDNDLTDTEAATDPSGNDSSIEITLLGGSYYFNKDAIIENVKSKVMESVLPGGLGGLGGLDAMPSSPSIPSSPIPEGTGLGIPSF